MLKLLKLAVWVGAVLLAVSLAYGWTGYRDAQLATDDLKVRADRLIDAGRDGIGLGPGRQDMLLAVEDPAFMTHVGFDITTPGAGFTTITQSLAKREGFADFTPGLRKLRQTGYALGMEQGLSKPQILALFLESVPMGPGPDGPWIDGLYAASAAHFDAPPAQLDDAQFLQLVATMIAPRDLPLSQDNANLAERTRRIAALVAGECAPIDRSDVWLLGCAAGGESG